MEENSLLLRLLVLPLLLGINGFFAAAEVALVSVRQTRMRQDLASVKQVPAARWACQTPVPLRASLCAISRDAPWEQTVPFGSIASRHETPR